MFCKKCGNKTENGAKLCRNCESLSNIRNKCADPLAPPMRREMDMQALVIGILQIFSGCILISSIKYCGVVVGVVCSGCFIIVGMLRLLSAFPIVYDIRCPYCTKSITVQNGCGAMDCPVCKERILIENYKGITK